MKSAAITPVGLGKAHVLKPNAMKSDNVKVIIKVEKGFQGALEPVAFFPEIPATRDPSLCLCYREQGQHGSANVVLASALPQATEEQAAPLLAVLQRVGYTNLQRVRKFTRKHQAAREEYLKPKAMKPTTMKPTAMKPNVIKKQTLVRRCQESTLRMLQRAGIIQEFYPDHDYVDAEMGRYFLKGREFVIKYLDGCFYPFVFEVTQLKEESKP